jgi:hypothetical protein
MGLSILARITKKANHQRANNPHRMRNLTAIAVMTVVIQVRNLINNQMISHLHRAIFQNHYLEEILALTLIKVFLQTI